MHSAWYFAGAWGNTANSCTQNFFSGQNTALQLTGARLPLFLQQIFQPNNPQFFVGKRRNLVKNTPSMFMAHVSLLALVNHFKEDFSEDRRFSGGRPAPQRQLLGCLVCPFAHSSGPNKAAVLSGIALYHVIFAVLLECFFLYTLFRFWSYIICLTTRHL